MYCVLLLDAVAGVQEPSSSEHIGTISRTKIGPGTPAVRLQSAPSPGRTRTPQRARVQRADRGGNCRHFDTIQLEQRSVSAEGRSGTRSALGPPNFANKKGFPLLPFASTWRPFRGETVGHGPPRRQYVPRRFQSAISRLHRTSGGRQRAQGAGTPIPPPSPALKRETFRRRSRARGGGRRRPPSSSPGRSDGRANEDGVETNLGVRGRVAAKLRPF